MGSKSTKLLAPPYEEAVKKLTADELERIEACFKRYAQSQDYITFRVFSREVLSEEAPEEFAKALYDAFGATAKGLSLKKLVCGLVAIAKGDVEEKIKFLFNIFSTDGDYVYSYDIMQSMRMFEHNKIPQCVHRLFSDQGANCDRVNYQTFFKWAVINQKSLTITDWLLDSPLTLTCANNYPTFYQTLAGVTHLDENEIVSIEKQYSRLVDYRVGKVTLDQFRTVVSPPIPDALVEGLFIAFDENGDHQVDFKEMVCGISACCRGPKVERHKFIFKIFDRNCDGKLDQSDVQLMVDQMLLIRFENSPILMENDDPASLDSELIVEEIFKQANIAQSELLTLDDFRMWSFRSKLPDDLLVVLYQLCHVVFGLPPATKDDEKVIVKLWIDRETRRGYTDGQCWYLIARQWWQQWLEWMDYQEPSTSSRGSSPTPKLSNKSLGGSSMSMNELSSTDSSNGAPLTVQPTQTMTKLEMDDKTFLLGTNPKKYADRTHSSESGWESESNASQSSSTKQQTFISYNQNPNAATASPSKLSTTSSSTTGRNWSPCPRHLYNAEKTVEPKQPVRPGPIDNTPLLAKDKTTTSKLVSLTSEGGILKSDAVSSNYKNFQLIPEPLWNALSRWYRGGTPALPRRVILCPESKELEIEFYPVVLTLLRHQQPAGGQSTSNQPQSRYTNQNSGAAQSSFGVNFFSGVSSFTINTASAAVNSAMHLVSHTPHRMPMYTVAFSKLSTISELFSFLCRQLRLNPDTARLWLLLPTDDSNNNMLLLEDESLTLRELKLESGSQVLIEVRNTDLTWPEEMSGLAKNRQILDKSSSVSSHQTSERGLTGLNNLGNTCFMNSALQCVSNTQPLTQYFTRNVHLYELNRESALGMKGQIALQYANLVQELWSGSARVTAPLKLRYTVCKYKPIFNDFNQHDCQELLSFLLDGLHEDLNRVHQKPYSELKDSDGRPDEIVAAEVKKMRRFFVRNNRILVSFLFLAWDNHIRRNQSVIVDLFHGLLKSTVVCLGCQKASVRFDPFTFLSLPLPLDNYIFVQIVVIKLNGSTPIKYGLRLSAEERVSNMKEKLSELCGITCHKLLLLQLSGFSLIQELLRDTYRVKPYANATLYAYELPEDDAHQAESTSKEHTKSALPNELKPSVHQSLSVTTNNGSSSNNAFENSSHRRSASNVSSSSASSMSTISASVYPSLTDSTFSGYTIGIQRRTDHRDVYFVAHQRYSPVIFGLPMILPADVDSKTWSGKGLYNAVWCHVARLVSPVPKQMAQINHALDGDENLYSEYPYELKMVMRQGGLRCAKCPWFKFCTGCLIVCGEDVRVDLTNCFVAVDWDITALHLRYQHSLEMQFDEHPSVKQAYAAQMEPVSLDSCLKAFTQPEELKDRDNYFCSNCKTHCPANKKLDIWKLPPILIFHFKRFQYVNERWVKSCKMVTFPQKDFDPSHYLANVSELNETVTPTAVDVSPLKETFIESKLKNLIANGSIVNGKDLDSEEESSPSDVEETNSDTVNIVNMNGLKKGGVKMSFKKKLESISDGSVGRRTSESAVTVLKCGEHNHRLKSEFDENNLHYDLYAIACHAGMLGAGHYVAYAKSANSKWYLYNDSSCKEIDPKDIDCSLAYILFYERRGLDYGKYIPDLKGKTPQNLDAADREIDSEVKRLCSIQ